MSAKPVTWLNVSRLPRANVPDAPSVGKDVMDIVAGAALVFLIVAIAWMAFL